MQSEATYEILFAGLLKSPPQQKKTEDNLTVVDKVFQWFPECTEITISRGIPSHQSLCKHSQKWVNCWTGWMITSYSAPVISLSGKCGYSVTTRGISEIYDTLTNQFLSSVGVWTSPRAICFTQAPSFVKRLCFICLYDSQAVNRTISKGISSPWINLSRKWWMRK